MSKGEQPKTGSATLRPRARLISLIGDELISDEPVAVVELVKNAYDADARRVTVTFEGEGARPKSIVIDDDGCGMDLATVLGAWFEPGTICKKRSEKSPKGRLYQGAKGIGRFASARLAESLLLESKKAGAEEGVCVLLEWGKFSDDSYLDEIQIEYQICPIKGLEHGTRLTMCSVRKEWSSDDYEDLHNRLSRLISPFNEIKDFEIMLQCEANPEISGAIQPPDLILQPRYLLKGNLNKAGCFNGNLLYGKEMLKCYNDLKLGGKGATPHCGELAVEIRAWDRDKEGLEPLGKELGMGVAEMRRTLNAFCGVSIYRDGFRVYPYGQVGNDWLGLDLRSRQVPAMRLANNQVVAAIQISRHSNPELKDRANREGLVLNDEYADLRNWFEEILALLEKERYSLRPRQESTEDSQPLFESLDLSATVKKVSGELGRQHPVTALIVDADKKVKDGIGRIQDVFSRLLMASGLGQMVDIVIHEIGSPLGKINRQIALLQKDVEQIREPDILARIQKKIDQMQPWLEQIRNLRQRLDPQTPAKRGRASTFSVREEVEDDFQLYESLLSKQGIKHSLEMPDGDFKVMMSRAALGQIMANLIDNAVFWISREHGQGKGGEIHVRIERIDGGFSVVVSDDGPGVAPEDKSKIFEPYFSTKPNGMGLGLHISRLVIESYGRLLLLESGDLSGACFEARFERKVGL